MKRGWSITFTVIGWLTVLVCAGGLTGGIATLSNGAVNESEVRTICLCCGLGIVVGFLIILRKKLFRRRSQARQAEAMEPEKPAGAGFLMILAAWMLMLGAMLLIRFLPMLLRAGKLYASSAAAAGGMIASLLLIALAVFLYLKPVRSRRKAGWKPHVLVTALTILFLFSTVVAVPLTLTMTKKHQPALDLTQRQKEDWNRLLKNSALLSTPYPSSADEGACPGGEWLALRVPGYESDSQKDLPESRIPVAWSEARIFAGGWLEGKPQQSSLDSIRVLILCRYSVKTASYGREQYSSTVGVGTGSSEFVELYYIDLQTGKVFAREQFGQDLPQVTTKVPHYKVDYEQLAEHIQNYLKTAPR